MATEQPTKKCLKCGVEQPPASFPQQRVSPKGVVYRKSRCNSCVAERLRTLRVIDPAHRAHKNAMALKWRKANPGKYKDCIDNWTLKHKYGIGVADYDRMLAAQGGGCAICGSIKSYSKRGGRFHVDHCHATGKVRGLLCQACNTTLGQMRENPDTLRAAAAYLERHGVWKPELVAA